MEYKWRRTTREVYLKIYDQHKDDFTVFESYTSMGLHGEALEAQITAWGFKSSSVPLIRSELRFGEWIYSILGNVESDE